jgi:uncharacterized membrane protein
MNPIVDGIMIVLFILFMVFIFGGYHKNKSAQREKDRALQELKDKSKEDNS